MSTFPSATRDILADLVAFPTVSTDSNLNCVAYIADFLKQHGVESTLVHDDTGRKANIFANIGPEVPGGIILSGHTDVVPVIGQDWSTNPWELTEKEGKLFARGACDMKGFIASCLAALPDMLAADLRRPIQLAFSYDEEVGALGANRLAPAMVAALPQAELVIVGEPSLMKVVTGHKGCVGGRTHVRGFEIHSSMPHKGVSAIMMAARIIEWLSAQSEANRVKAINESPYEPPYTTGHSGTIQGGTASNITAKDCVFDFDFRILPGETPEQWKAAYLDYVKTVEADMQAVHPDTFIDVQWNFQMSPLGAADGSGRLPNGDDNASETFLRKLTGDNGQHVVSYGTDAAAFQDAGLPVAICGPGSIDQAHQPNEFITIAELEKCDAFLKRLIGELVC